MMVDDGTHPSLKKGRRVFSSRWEKLKSSPFEGGDYI